MRARHILGALSLLTLAAGSRELSAQQARKPITLGFALNSVAIDRAAADVQAVHDRSAGVQLDLGYTGVRYFFLGGDFGYSPLSDHAGFTQGTTAGDRKSSAALMSMSAVVGPRTPSFRLGGPLPMMSLGLLAGATKTVGERSIDNCLDCRMDKLEILGGTFVQPTVVLGGKNARLRVSDRHFTKGDGLRYIVSAGVEVGGR